MDDCLHDDNDDISTENSRESFTRDKTNLAKIAHGEERKIDAEPITGNTSNIAAPCSIKSVKRHHLEKQIRDRFNEVRPTLLRTFDAQLKEMRDTMIEAACESLHTPDSSCTHDHQTCN